jgi:dTDP-4-dehydrorhamnose 3,5-epimerase
MINDVSIKKIASHHDDRGFFAEISKIGEETFHQPKQINYTESYPGVIKAFHYHKKQWDVWCVLKGMVQVVLFDTREKSTTKYKKEVYYCGEKNLLLIAIPPGVAHGYRVLGDTPAGLLYYTTALYNSKKPDGERIAYDDPRIGFDWDTKFR